MTSDLLDLFASEPLNHLYYQPKRNYVVSFAAPQGYVLWPNMPLYWHGNFNILTLTWTEISHG